MKKIKEEKRIIPLKNYLILFLIFVITILLTFYVNEWVKTYNKNKISFSPLSNKVNEININELDAVLNETGKVILYVSYTNDKNIYNNETKLLKVLKKNDKLDYIMYLNINDYLKNDEYLNILKNKFSNIESKIEKAPLFIYINNGVALSVINSSGRIVDDSDFTQIVEMYEIEN